jgi:hypothetical protein
VEWVHIVRMVQDSEKFVEGCEDGNEHLVFTKCEEFLGCSFKKHSAAWSWLVGFFQLRTAAFKAYCAILVRRSNFCHQATPRVSPRESTQRRKVELWARNVREICLNANLHVTFRDILHAVKLRHGIDGFTSPPKEGVLRIVSP